MSDEQPGRITSQRDVVFARVIAFVLDSIISLIVAVIVGYAFSLVFNGWGGLGVILGSFGYFIILEGYTGQTLGKRATGVIVVTQTGTKISFRKSFIRNVLRVIDGLMGYSVGLVAILVTRDYQRIGDLAAGTMVIEARANRGSTSVHNSSSSESRRTVR